MLVEFQETLIRDGIAFDNRTRLPYAGPYLTVLLAIPNPNAGLPVMVLYGAHAWN